MISYSNALKLLKKYVKDPKVIIHSEGAAKFASMLADKVDNKHPEFKINKEKIRIAALLHDIGKEEQHGHEERSLKILEKEGLQDIAKITVHGFSYFINNKNRNLSQTEKIENMIVVYSDVRFKFAPTTTEERLQEAKAGWKGTPEEIKAKEKQNREIVSKFEKKIFKLVGKEF